MPNFEGFDWDEGNAEKNWIKHRVSPSESEQVFFNRPLFVSADTKNSKEEKRYYALGVCRTLSTWALCDFATINNGKP